MILAALALYLWGVRRNNALHPRHPWSIGKTAAWIGALLTTGVAIFSFVGVYDGELFWDHMVQHLLLIMVAAPLFAIASPLELASALHHRYRPHRRHRGAALTGGKVPRPPGRRIRALRRADPGQPPHELVQPHARAREHPQRRASRLPPRGLHVLAPDLRERPELLSPPPCHAVLLPVLGDPHRHVHRPVAGGRDEGALPAYFATHRIWGPSYVTDLHVGGSIMSGVVGDTLMLWPMIPVALRWMHMDERSAVRVDRELDAQALAESRPSRRGGSRASATRFDGELIRPVGVRAVDGTRAGRRRSSQGVRLTRRPHHRAFDPGGGPRRHAPGRRGVQPSWLTADARVHRDEPSSLEGEELDGRRPFRMNWEVTATSGRSMCRASWYR